MTWQEEQHKVELQAKLQQMEMKMVQGKQAGAKSPQKQKADDHLWHLVAMILALIGMERYGLYMII